MNSKKGANAYWRSVTFYAVDFPEKTNKARLILGFPATPLYGGRNYVVLCPLGCSEYL